MVSVRKLTAALAFALISAAAVAQEQDPRALRDASMACLRQRIDKDKFAPGFENCPAVLKAWSQMVKDHQSKQKAIQQQQDLDLLKKQKVGQ